MLQVYYSNTLFAFVNRIYQWASLSYNNIADVVTIAFCENIFEQFGLHVIGKGKYKQALNQVIAQIDVLTDINCTYFTFFKGESKISLIIETLENVTSRSCINRDNFINRFYIKFNESDIEYTKSRKVNITILIY